MTREHADVLLSDGTVASIRPVAPDDGPALVALHDEIGPENVRLRFFSASRVAGRQYVAHVLASPQTLALVAVRHEQVVGLGTAEPVEPGAAEIAFLVADECHGLGMGSLLLEHLAAAGRERGIRRFTAEVLAENAPMLDVLRHAGFAVTNSTESGCVMVEMDTTASYDALRAADERECRAEALSLSPLLRPHSVAVVGVRRDGTGVGAQAVRSIVAGGFTGSLHVVHPGSEPVEGVPVVASLTALTEELDAPPDVVVVAVPAIEVVEVLREAAQAGCRGAVVLSAGFAELGGEGARLQEQVLEVARASSMRVIGPNCLGLLNTHPAVRLDATLSGIVPPAGGLALASQSGGVGVVLADLARQLGVGIGMLVSLGNKVDVSGNDLLAAWRDDAHVTAAGLYLESFGNAPKFARMAREFSERKPLLAVVGGRLGGEERAGVSHAAAAATSQVGLRTLFAQAGVIGCESAEELVECALLLGRQPLPQGRRVAVLTNAGGVGVLAADNAEAAGLTVSRLENATATATPAEVGACADDLLAADDVDALIVLLVASPVGDALGAAELLPEVRRRYPEKPVLLVPLGGLHVEPAGLDGVTAYRTAGSALRALMRAAGYAEWRREPHRPDPPGDSERAFRARAVAQEITGSLEVTENGGWLAAGTARSLLEEYGLAPEGRLVVGVRASVAAAESMGFPVAVKVAGHGIVHRTDLGLVRVGLRSAREVARTVAAFKAELDSPLEVLVQSVAQGTEIALGVVRDPRFGPLVMVGAGGVASELWDDRAFLLPPVSGRDAARAIRSLRVWPLLRGYRGAPARDVTALEDVLVRLGRLAEDVPAIAEMELDPVIVGRDGCHLVDVKVRLADQPVLDAGVPRRLRDPG